MSIVKINNLDKVQRLFLELPKKQEKVVNKNGLAFMKSVRKSAKLMAPRDTGELAESIRLKPTKVKGKTKQYLLEVTAPYASFQEYGFKPHFAYIQNSSKMVPGVYFVKKNTPFIKPAIERNLSRFLQNLNRGMKEVIKT